MKKFLLTCCLLLGIVAVSHAQGGMRRSPEERAKMLQTRLNLSDDQTAKITVIYKDQMTKIDSVRNAGGDFSAFRPIMQATNEKVKAVLTTDQAVAYDKMMEEMRARFRQRGGGGGGN